MQQNMKNNVLTPPTPKIATDVLCKWWAQLMYFDIVLALLSVVNALKLYSLGVSNLGAYLI